MRDPEQAVEHATGRLTGALTLDGQNLVNRLFVFQIGSALTTARSPRPL
jgi:hypothetical protein